MSRMVRAYEWDTGEIPENNHEAPLFVKHVPGLRNTFLSFPTVQVCVERKLPSKSRIHTKRSDKAK